MPEIAYKDFDQFANKHNKDSFASIYLICGEEFLCETVFAKLVNILLEGKEKGLDFELVDGSSGNVPVALESINTFSFFGDKKVVALTNARVFYSRQDETPILEKAKDAFDKNELKKASRHLLNLLSLNNLSIEEVLNKEISQFLKIDFTSFGGSKWLDKLISFTAENGYKVKVSNDESKQLQEAVIKGFPQNNHLIITTDIVDKRRVLYKTIKEQGIIIDCTVSKGNLQADRKVQETFLRESMNKILAKHNKRMEPAAYHALCEMTGFDLRIFSNSIEQLSIYIGERNLITANDVTLVLKRTKLDPVYEITNAMSKRSYQDALFYAKTLIAANFHPLQLLLAIVNNMRKMLIVKEFTESSVGRVWNRNMQYYQFKTDVMPVIIKYDVELSEKISALDNLYQKEKELREKIKKEKEEREKIKNEENAQKRKKNSSLKSANKSKKPKKIKKPTKIKKAKKVKKGKKVITDLVVAKNHKSPYPVFLSLQASNNYSLAEILRAFEILGQADMRLKSSGSNPHLILEDTILKICRKNS